LFSLVVDSNPRVGVPLLRNPIHRRGGGGGCAS
jgi:hypothetical protein